MARILGIAVLDEQPIMAALSGRSVALVGNARSLGTTALGAMIDSADLVIRLNGAPLPGAVSHGTRTDWLALSVPVPPSLIAARAPSRILWMTRKRKRLPVWLARDPRLHLSPKPGTDALERALGAPPSTGAMVCDLLIRSDAARITLYGFDFFASLSLSGRRTARDVPHDFAAERDRLLAVMGGDRRLHLEEAPLRPVAPR